jgi:hypothetical protein
VIIISGFYCVLYCYTYKIDIEYCTMYGICGVGEQTHSAQVTTAVAVPLTVRYSTPGKGN